jgi:hypothetical protein
MYTQTAIIATQQQIDQASNSRANFNYDALDRAAFAHAYTVHAAVCNTVQQKGKMQVEYYASMWAACDIYMQGKRVVGAHGETKKALRIGVDARIAFRAAYDADMVYTPSDLTATQQQINTASALDDYDEFERSVFGAAYITYASFCKHAHNVYDAQQGAAGTAEALHMHRAHQSIKPGPWDINDYTREEIDAWGVEGERYRARSAVIAARVHESYIIANTAQ